MGSNPMCRLPKAVTGDTESAGDIPMWGSSIMDDYRKVVQGAGMGKLLLKRNFITVTVIITL